MFRTVDGVDELLTTLQPPKYFGERALLRERPSEFAVKVCSDEARLLVLDGPTFNDLAGLLRNDPAFRHALDDDLVSFAQYKGGHHHKLAGLLPRLKQAKSLADLPDLGKEDGNRFNESSFRLDPNTELITSSLDRVGVLGMGAYGIVTLEKDRTTGEMFALKTMSKGLICQNKLQENVKNERELLTMVDSPFTIKLMATFKDQQYLYMLFEPILGGDLHNHLHARPEQYRQSKVYKFLIGCVCVAFEHLHERNIVFRDLKPENILVGNDGYPKLCDFGFAKFVLGRAMTLCGTPEYVAPEVIAHGGYDRMVDWWALGILTFELVTGSTPFADEDEDAPPVVIFCNIKAGIDEVHFPFRERDVISFIKSCCKSNPARRLGIGGAREVMRHAMLKDLPFEALQATTFPAPYVPVLATPEDMTSLHTEDQEPPPFVEYDEDDGSDWANDF